jgi:hypothetical protein
MDRSSAPGPDGLGSSFYRAAWASILPQVIRLFDAFHAGRVDLDRINRVHVVLLPKKPGTPDPGAFRPISLQNCSVKILCKVLTSRLQAQIADLIDIKMVYPPCRPCRRPRLLKKAEEVLLLSELRAARTLEMDGSPTPSLSRELATTSRPCGVLRTWTTRYPPTSRTLHRWRRARWRGFRRTPHVRSRGLSTLTATRAHTSGH